jgi:uncharacterized protein
MHAMDFLVITIVSFLVAGLTLVSGFGLGTLLMPAFAIFFPLEVAIAATAVVHLLNNIFKIALVGRWASRRVTLRFGIPAILAAFVGAALMTVMADTAPIYRYTLGPIEAEVTWLRLVIALLLATFAALELWPRYHTLSFPPSALPVGGLASGFFGGISGMQGALRAPFLLRAGLSREQYVGTAAVISTIVDVARLGVYAVGLTWIAQRHDAAVLADSRTLWLVFAACLAGFLGSFIGSKMVRKVTLRGIQRLVAMMLLAVAAALAAGVV